MKKIMLLAAVILAALALAGCAGNKDFPTVPTAGPMVTQVPPLALATATPLAVPGLPEGYDPSAEEDRGTFADNAYDALGNARYAGATPIPLDPIDLPTPTPRPSLAFTYAAYTAEKLGLTFESVIGYTVDDKTDGVYILTEPANQQKDGVTVVITLTVSSVTSNYKEGDIKTDLRALLATMGSTGYKEWQPTNVAARTLLDKPGYYADYRGVRTGGEIERGRVHMALIGGNKLLKLQITCPGWYNTSYMTVYTHIRNTIKAI